MRAHKVTSIIGLVINKRYIIYSSKAVHTNKQLNSVGNVGAKVIIMSGSVRLYRLER